MIVVARDAASGRWRVFERPVEIVTARRVDEVIPALEKVEAECANNGRYAAGFISYEAAPAFDRALVTWPPDNFPLLCFGLYETPGEGSLDDVARKFAEMDVADTAEVWTPSVTPAGYAHVFDALQELIRSGDTYQVNFTYRLRTRLTTDPFSLFIRLVEAQQPPFGAYVDTGEWVVCSASPELFFHRRGATIESRPMKGTATRGLWFEQDLEQAHRLRESEKERAENVMIVDMVRNDLGRIALPGTVRVTNLFDVERYPTVLQLTSTVFCDTDASIVDIFKAVFPAASITGAPKTRTMEIIAEMESAPRRIYTGTIGFIEPGGRAQFSVAIRTVLVNTATGEAEYGVGGGIVADSAREDEWAETRVKAKVLGARAPSFELLETMLWTPDGGYLLVSRHMKRLLQSADYFGFQLDLFEVERRLAELASSLPREPHRVRLTISKGGGVGLSAARQKLDQGFDALPLAANPVDIASPFLYHKTTNRTIYEAALAAAPGFTDVLLYNERREVTESTIANVVIEIEGELITPPIRCGLLPGTLRAHLLDEGRIRENTITVDMLRGASARYLMNSVRGFHPVSVLTNT